MSQWLNTIASIRVLYIQMQQNKGATQGSLSTYRVAPQFISNKFY